MTAASSRPGRAVSRDAGSVTVLVVGFLVVVGLLVAVVVDASAAYLRRQSMAALADGAALAAAEGVQGELLYTGGLGKQAPVDAAVAQRYVAAYLIGVDAPGDLPGLTWQVDTTVGGTVVRVRLAAPLDLPVTPTGWTESVTVAVDASATVAVS
jgi:uncharacterized membrane protein